jgi:hypothetical protein
MIFLLNVHFDVLQMFHCQCADLGNKLSIVLLLPAVNYYRCHCYWQLINADVIVTADEVIAIVMESMKIQNKA